MNFKDLTAENLHELPATADLIEVDTWYKAFQRGDFVLGFMIAEMSYSGRLRMIEARVNLNPKADSRWGGGFYVPNETKRVKFSYMQQDLFRRCGLAQKDATLGRC